MAHPPQSNEFFTRSYKDGVDNLYRQATLRLGAATVPNSFMLIGENFGE